MRFSFFSRRSSSPRLARLAGLSLFVQLTAAERAIVDGLLHERDYLPEEVIFDEGEEGQAIYIVLEGEVVIRKQGQPNGGTIARLGPGTFFGDLALLDDSPRIAQARAATPCHVAVFFRADFMSLLETHALIASKISLQLARHIGLRLRDATVLALNAQHL